MVALVWKNSFVQHFGILRKTILFTIFSYLHSFQIKKIRRIGKNIQVNFLVLESLLRSIVLFWYCFPLLYSSLHLLLFKKNCKFKILICCKPAIAMIANVGICVVILVYHFQYCPCQIAKKISGYCIPTFKDLLQQ